MWVPVGYGELGFRHPQASIVACDFFTVESVFLRRYYALFFIAHGSRRVSLGGCTMNPTGAWVTQQARNLGLDFSDHGVRFLIRDRDSKYSGPFDEVFSSEGIRIVKTPVRAPKANAIAERFVRTVRAECLDWLLIVNRRHLEGILRVYVDHYNHERPHRALELRPPEPDQQRERSPGGRDPSSRPARRPHPRVLPSRRMRRDTNKGALQPAALTEPLRGSTKSRSRTLAGRARICASSDLARRQIGCYSKRGQGRLTRPLRIGCRVRLARIGDWIRLTWSRRRQAGRGLRYFRGFVGQHPAIVLQSWGSSA